MTDAELVDEIWLLLDELSWVQRGKGFRRALYEGRLPGLPDETRQAKPTPQQDRQYYRQDP